MIRRPLVTLAMGLAFGCVQEPTVPRLRTQEITLRIESSTTVLAPGATDTITVVATSHLTEPVRIIFATNCQILLYVRTRSAHTVVPQGGTHTCIPVPSQMVIPAEGSVSQAFLWNGGNAFDAPGTTRLAAGEYFLLAEMNVGDVRTVAAAVRVTLLP
jgi:hypothetical protein